MVESEDFRMERGIFTSKAMCHWIRSKARYFTGLRGYSSSKEVSRVFVRLVTKQRCILK